MKFDPIPIAWHSVGGIPSEFHPEILSALAKDVGDLDSSAISTTNCYSYGKQVATGGRLALITEKVDCLH